MKLVSLPLACAIVVGFAAQPANAGTLLVPAEYPSITAAVAASQPGDEIVIACGTYYESHIVFKNGVIVRSEARDPSCVTIDAQQEHYVAFVPDVDATGGLEGITFTGGLSPGTGGAMQIGYPSTLTITRCDFVGNSVSHHAGAVACFGSSPVFEYCRFIDNSSPSGDGGAVYLNTSSAIFRNCEFRNNAAPEGHGGAVFASASTPRFENCVFTENTSYNGGAVMIWSAPTTFERCVFERNVSTMTGAAYVYEGSGTFVECVFNGNQALIGGALKGLSNSTIELVECTVTSNHARDGGGVHLTFNSTLHARFSTILSNTASVQGADGYLMSNCSAWLECSTVDAATWEGDGPVNIDFSNCPIPIQSNSWGRVKATFGP